MISFTVYGASLPSGSKTAGVTKAGRRFVRDSNPAAKEWKRQVAQAAGEQMNGRALLRGPLCVGFVFHRPRPAGHYGKHGIRPAAPKHVTTRPDCLKLARAVEDALQGVIYADDAQIVEETIAKYFGEPARVEITIRPLGEEMA